MTAPDADRMGAWRDEVAGVVLQGLRDAWRDEYSPHAVAYGVTDSLLPLLARIDREARREERDRAKVNDDVRREQIRMARGEALRKAADELRDLALALASESDEEGHALTAAIVDRCQRIVRDRADTIAPEVSE